MDCERWQTDRSTEKNRMKKKKQMMKHKYSRVSRKLGTSPKDKSTDIVASKDATESRYRDLSFHPSIAWVSNQRPTSADVDAGTPKVFATDADFGFCKLARAVWKGGTG